MRPIFAQRISEAFAAHKAARIERHPYAVSQAGLLRLKLGDDEFLVRLDERHRWIANNCMGSFMFDDLTSEIGDITGKLYRFENLYEACWFRLLF